MTPCARKPPKRDPDWQRHVWGIQLAYEREDLTWASAIRTLCHLGLERRKAEMFLAPSNFKGEK